MRTRFEIAWDAAELAKALKITIPDIKE
jgi:hypothetical protein